MQKDIEFMNYVRACVISHDIRTKGPRLATVLLLMPFCFFFLLVVDTGAC
jgi:hypothetical protein